MLEHVTKDKELLEVRDCYPEFSSTNRAWYVSCISSYLTFPKKTNKRIMNYRTNNLSRGTAETNNLADKQSPHPARLFSCREFKVFLPHNYGRDPHNSNHPTLALAIDEAQNCFKMLKALHRAPRLASDGEPLYADCRVVIKQFLVSTHFCTVFDNLVV